MKVTCGCRGRKTEEGAFCEKCGARLFPDAARKRMPLGITEAILAPYRRFMEERF